MRANLLIVVIAFLSLSCGSGTPLEFEGDPRPIFQGLFYTLENSPEPVGKWGSPQRASGDFAIDIAFPNPAKGHTNMVVILPEASHVKIWITRAILPSELSYTTQGGAVIPEPIPGSIAVLKDAMLEPGSHLLEWKIDSTEFPAGPYRIYMNANNRLTWTDVWLYSSSADMPPFLRRFAN